MRTDATPAAAFESQYILFLKPYANDSDKSKSRDLGFKWKVAISFDQFKKGRKYLKK